MKKDVGQRYPYEFPERGEKKSMEHLSKLWSSVQENVGFVVVAVLIVVLLIVIAKFFERIYGLNGGQRQSGAKRITVVGMNAALAVILMVFEFQVPFAPGFYKLDFSEIPILICAFAMGPVAGIIAELVKVILNLLMDGTTTVFVGEFANFIIGCSFVLPASIIYLRHKTKKSAVIACVAGTVTITIFGSLFNAFYLLPTFAKLYHMELNQLIAMGSAIFPSIDGITKFVFFCVAPLNLIKGLVVSLVVILIYKPISRILHQRV